MKKRIQLTVFLVLGLIVVLTGCGNKENNTTATDKPSEQSNVEAQSEETKEEVTEEDIIKQFYDGFYDIYTAIEGKNYSSLNDLVQSTETSIAAFDEMTKGEETDNESYFTTMENNHSYQHFKTWYLSNPDLKEFMGIEEFQETWAYAINICIQDILKIKLPFDYDKQNQFAVSDGPADNQSNEEKDYDKLAKDYLSFLNDCINAGYDIACDAGTTGTNNYALMSSIALEANGVNYEIKAQIAYDTVKSERDFMFSVFNLSMADMVNSLEFIGGDEKVEINSSHFSLFGSGYSYCFIHNTEYSDSMNAEYEKLRTLFANNSTVSVKFDGNEFSLSEKDIKTIRQYFAMYDVLLAQYS